MKLFALALFLLQCWLAYVLGRFVVRLYKGQVPLERLPRGLRSGELIKLLAPFALVGLLLNAAVFGWVFLHGH